MEDVRRLSALRSSSGKIALEHLHRVSISELMGRALSFSPTSPAVLGDKRPQFEAEIKAGLERFAIAGGVEEEVRAKATIFKGQSTQSG